MTTITLQQSLCGENDKRAYGLLKTTVANIDDAKALAHKSDLPDHTQGVDFEPAIRGFAIGSYFVVLKTFKDLSPSVRPNRVFTHMLSGSLKEVSHFDDLASIFKNLQSAPNKTAKITDLSVQTSNDRLISKLNFKPRFNKLVHAYVHADEYANTIVWVGQADFEEAVAALWAEISPEERTAINFGIYFGTENLPKDKINLICISLAVKSKFNRSGFCVIDQNDTYEPKELSEQILAGDKTAGKRINEFGKAIDVRYFKRNEVNDLAIVLSTYETMTSVTDLKKLNTLSHIIAKFAPAAEKGSGLKSTLINRIVEVMAQATPTELVILKHFKIDSFSKAKKSLSDGVGAWMKKYLFIPSTRKISDMTSLFDLLEGNSNWLKETLEKNLKTFLREPELQNISIVYQWLASSSKTLTVVGSYIGDSASVEQMFIEGLPTGMGAGVRQELTNFAEKKGWYRLFAHLLLLSKIDIEKCYDRLLKIDTDYTFYGALDILIRKSKAAQVFHVTIQNPDPRLVKYCGLMSREKPALLSKIDVTEIGWQKIWLAAVEEGNELKDGLKNGKNTVEQILDLLVAKKPVEQGIVDKISESSFASVLDYPNRLSLWNVLPSDAKQQFLRATSSKLLEDLSKTIPTNVPDDTVLSNFIISNGISDFLYYNSNKFSSTLPIFLRYQSLPERTLADYVRNYRGEPSQKEAVKLGKLITQRHYNDVANVIYDRAEKKNNWCIVLDECHDLLSLRQRAWILIAGLIKTVRIPSDDWWKGVSDLIIEFYPNTTRLTTIWTKAGGKEYDLISSGTVRDIWLNALYMLRHRGYKHISMNNLLKEINKDYGHDADFKTYYEIRKHFIKTN